ncbi:hypothetical protein [Vibrio phage vB_VpaP_SJSY21]|nr:hypothetical protein [Vibrio phage vB_VpaP_SJSY21]
MVGTVVWETEEFYNEGFSAFNLGMTLEDCPYEVGTPEEEFWVIGWKDRQAEHGAGIDV